jgi:hypothetical protein
VTTPDKVSSADDFDLRWDGDRIVASWSEGSSYREVAMDPGLPGAVLRT